jgi:repressor LexA
VASSEYLLALRAFFGYRAFGNCSGYKLLQPLVHSLPDSSMPLTKRQREILDYLAAYAEEHGYAPSFEEIANRFNYNSLATVHEHLSNLERKGYIKRSYNESRAIEILPSEAFARAIELPLLGNVAAGVPIEAVAHQESLSVPEEFVRRTGNHYVLRVRGNSMIDEQIRDGDFVVVNERQRADNGEMVIAMLHGNSATVKKFYRERDGRIRLQPANETLSPMYVHENDISIQGIVVGVLRRY